MSGEPQLFRVDIDSKEPKRIKEVEFSGLGLKERQDIQEWVADHPDILGEELLIIGKEFSGFDRTNERLDLLGIDKEGKLVVIELKRDDSGTDAHWQAIKYASYLHAAKQEDIIRMFAMYKREMSLEDAASELERHLGADDLSGLNNAQRIILVSHRFAPEVTSAALWLNEQAGGDNLISCVKLTPFLDENSRSLYIQANTIIPVPGTEHLKIRVGEPTQNGGSSTFPDSMRTKKEQHKNDAITSFLRWVAGLVREQLPDDLKPDKQSRAAGDGGGPRSGRRQYHQWYSKKPWGNWDLSYSIFLYDKDKKVAEPWRAEIGLLYTWYSKTENLKARLKAMQVFNDQKFDEGRFKRVFVTRHGKALDESFAKKLARTMSRFVEEITPIIDSIGEAENEEDVKMLDASQSGA